MKLRPFVVSRERSAGPPIPKRVRPLNNTPASMSKSGIRARRRIVSSTDCILSDYGIPIRRAFRPRRSGGTLFLERLVQEHLDVCLIWKSLLMCQILRGFDVGDGQPHG